MSWEFGRGRGSECGLDTALGDVDGTHRIRTELKNLHVHKKKLIEPTLAYASLRWRGFSKEIWCSKL